MSAATGLRERKKQHTRESIAAAAFQLTQQNSLSEVTIDAIADLAFVSPRTFSNYFSSKEEAIVSAGMPHWGQLAARLEASAPSACPLTTLSDLTAAFLADLPTSDLRLAMQVIDLVEDNPGLRPFWSLEYDRLTEELRRVIADRTGTDAEDALYPGLTADAAVSAIRTSLRVWAHAGVPDGDALANLVRDSFGTIGAGLEPPAGSPHGSPHGESLHSASVHSAFVHRSAS